MPENEWVRVLDKDTGHKRSVRPPELPHGNYEVLDEDAVDARGDVLPPEHGTPAAGRTASKKNAPTIKELQAEIDTRNANRHPDAEDYISPAGTKKADLVSALEADDAAQSTQES